MLSNKIAAGVIGFVKTIISFDLKIERYRGGMEGWRDGGREKTRAQNEQPSGRGMEQKK